MLNLISLKPQPKFHPARGANREGCLAGGRHITHQLVTCIVTHNNKSCGEEGCYMEQPSRYKCVCAVPLLPDEYSDSCLITLSCLTDDPVTSPVDRVCKYMQPKPNQRCLLVKP